MLACQGRDMVQWSPVGWARHWVLIHVEALTIALASKADTAITLLHSQASITVRGQINITLLLRSQPSKHYSF